MEQLLTIRCATSGSITIVTAMGRTVGIHATTTAVAAMATGGSSIPRGTNTATTAFGPWTKCQRARWRRSTMGTATSKLATGN